VAVLLDLGGPAKVLYPRSGESLLVPPIRSASIAGHHSDSRGLGL